MKRVMVDVERCKDCPYFDGIAYCDKLDRFLKENNADIVHPDCPLPDVPEDDELEKLKAENLGLITKICEMDEKLRGGK